MPSQSFSRRSSHALNVVLVPCSCLFRVRALVLHTSSCVGSSTPTYPTMARAGTPMSTRRKHEVPAAAKGPANRPTFERLVPLYIHPPTHAPALQIAQAGGGLCPRGLSCWSTPPEASVFPVLGNRPCEQEAFGRRAWPREACRWAGNVRVGRQQARAPTTGDPSGGQDYKMQRRRCARVTTPRSRVLGRYFCCTVVSLSTKEFARLKPNWIGPYGGRQASRPFFLRLRVRRDDNRSQSRFRVANRDFGSRLAGHQQQTYHVRKNCGSR